MRKKFCLAFLLIAIFSCAESISDDEIDDIANLEYHLDQFISFDGLIVDSEIFKADTTLGNKIVFSFSDSHCLDCITKNLRIIDRLINQKLLTKENIILIADFNDKRLIKSYLTRFHLSGILNILTDQKPVELTEGIFDQPTFFLLKKEYMTAHFLYQPTLYTTKFSDMYLKALSKNLKKQQ